MCKYECHTCTYHRGSKVAFAPKKAFLATKLQGRASTWLNQVFLNYESLPLPTRAWSVVCVDQITGLPPGEAPMDRSDNVQPALDATMKPGNWSRDNQKSNPALHTVFVCDNGVHGRANKQLAGMKTCGACFTWSVCFASTTLCPAFCVL